MPSMTISELQPDHHAEQVVALLFATSPTVVTSAAEWLHRHRAIPERAWHLVWAAEVDGELVGLATAGVNFFTSGNSGYLSVRVHPTRRRNGIGTALYTRAVEHLRSLDVPYATSLFDENDDGVRFAASRGWHEVRAETISVLDPRQVTDPPETSIEIVPACRLDPRELHRVDEETTRDMPAVEPIDAIRYDEWLAFVWDNPLFTREGSCGAVVDGQVAAVSLVLANAELGRAMNMFTGTSREYRGRGLARAVKLASTRWAADNGITQIATTNDETNAAMLAVNKRLGYRPAGRRVELLLEREGLLRERGEHL
jgi:GNAT superfamily N-acetyltransferase